MIPTNELRFVKREIPLHPFYKAIDHMGRSVPAVQTAHILQQKWVNKDKVLLVNGKSSFEYEWRDVPGVKEIE